MRYVIYDSIGQSSNEGSIHFSWGCTPEANGDVYDVAYGQALAVTAPGVGGNDATCDLPSEVTRQVSAPRPMRERSTGIAVRPSQKPAEPRAEADDRRTA